MIEENRLAEWLDNTATGGYLKTAEQTFFATHTANPYGITVVASLCSWDCWPQQAVRLGRGRAQADVVCALPHLPLLSGSVQTLLLPHGLELCAQPEELLRECFRVLLPNGKLVLSGFNPYSLWRFGLPEKQLGLRAHALPLPKVRRMLAEAGFRPDTGRFMAYVPPWENERALQRWHFMELAGNRWWPAAAAAYSLAAVKTVYPLTPLREKAGKLRGEGFSLLPGNCRQG